MMQKQLSVASLPVKMTKNFALQKNGIKLITLQPAISSCRTCRWEGSASSVTYSDVTELGQGSYTPFLQELHIILSTAERHGSLDIPNSHREIMRVTSATDKRPSRSLIILNPTNMLHYGVDNYFYY